MFYLWFLSVSLASSVSIYDSLSQPNLNEFNIDDTDQLRNLSLAALPEIFGYSQERGLNVFPPYKYPPCSYSYLNTLNSIRMNFNNNTVEMTCAYEKDPYIIVGPDKHTKLSLPMESKRSLKRANWGGRPIEIEPFNEFALGSCVDSEYNRVNLYYLAPRFKKNLYEEALEKTDEISTVKRKPMMMIFLTVDSFSRRHFFRKLESTVGYLNQLKKDGEYEVFDYKLHNIIGADTAENQLRVFAEKWIKEYSGDQDTDFLGKDAIWYKMKKLGFMTLYGTDACAHNTVKSIGRRPKVDHSVNLFYCANYVFGDYRASKFRVSRQRCLGSHMAHHYLMDYSLQFSRMYKNASQ